MFRDLVLGIIAVLYLSSSVCVAQLSESKFSFVYPKRKCVTIPFQLCNNLIVIPLSINGSKALNFILDSGVGTTLITELGPQDSLEVAYSQLVKIYGLGEGDPVEAYFCKNNKIVMGDAIGEGININIMLENIYQFSSKAGIRINGLIGYDVFKHFVVDINYISKTVKLYKPETYTYKTNRKTATLPLLIFRNKPYVDAEVALGTDSVQKLRLLFDTGASDALWLFPTLSHPLVAPKDGIKMFLGYGLGGNLYGTRFRLKSLKLDSFILSGVVGSFPDSSSVSVSSFVDGRNGTLGGEVMRRFRVVVDYQGGKLSLTRNYTFFDRFVYNMSGLDVSRPFAGLPIYLVTTVMAGSPAGNAGILENDQILKIDNVSTSDLTLSELIGLLNEAVGKRKILTLKRDGVEYKVEIRLKDIL